MPSDATAHRFDSTERLLLAGGDARIATDPVTGLNKYLCSPRPDDAVAAFGSSTASTISPAAFAAADRLRLRLQAQAGQSGAAELYAREMERVRAELIALCDLSGLDGLGVAFAASGTDVHLLAAQLAAAADAAPMLAIVMDGAETGTGVPAALRGEHFSERSALGAGVRPGAALPDRQALQLVSVPLRRDDGLPRPAEAIDQEVEALALRALRRGRRVLLIAADLSKTGILAPGTSCLLELRNYAPDRIDVLVDACQFRLAPATLRGYLDAGCMVALTGSKFLTGPAFSGALMIPPRLAARLRECRLPRALADYSARADWPAGWAGAAALDEGANFGLLLRWEAALAELRAFRRVPEWRVRQILERFAAAVSGRLARDPLFEPLPTNPIERAPLASGWDRVPTIFPFLPCRRSARGVALPLPEAEAGSIYRLLQAGPARERFLLGQPVRCGRRGGHAVSALRLCASARLVVQAESGAEEALIAQALAALDKAAWLLGARHLAPAEAA